MSIINEALKKAQTELEEKKSRESPSSDLPTLKDPQSSPSTPGPQQKDLRGANGTIRSDQDLKSPPSPPSSQQPARKTLATIEKEELKKQETLESLQRSKTPETSRALYANPHFLKVIFLFLFICSLSLGGLYVVLSQDSFRSFLNKTFHTQAHRQSIPHETITVFSPSNPTVDSSGSSPNSVLTPVVATSDSLPPPAKQKMAPTTSLNLKGIVTMNNKQFALINDGIYEEGSIVQGKRVVKIALDQVELKDDTKGGILTLTIQAEHAAPQENP